MAPRPPSPPPSFFKVLIDPSVPHLPLPPDFVTDHLKNNIPKSPTLRSATGGHLWRLEIEEIGGNYCFTHGWNRVVDDARLGFGDFLVFWLVDKSTFKVSIYGQNGCEKNLPSKIKVEEEEDVDVVDVVDDDTEDGVDEEEDEEEQEQEEDDDDDDDDDSDDVDDDGGGVDDDGMDDDDDDDDEDEDDDYYCEEDNLFFRKTISGTDDSKLRLPAKFVKLTSIDTKDNIILKDLDENESPMKLRSDRNRWYLSSGWHRFRQSNKLSDGDVCLFKFIGNEGKLSLAKVTKNKPSVKRNESRSAKNNVATRKNKDRLAKNTVVTRKNESRSAKNTVVTRKNESRSAQNTVVTRKNESQSAKNTMVTRQNESRSAEKKVVTRKSERHLATKEVKRKPGRPLLEDSRLRKPRIIYF